MKYDLSFFELLRIFLWNRCSTHGTLTRKQRSLSTLLVVKFVRRSIWSVGKISMGKRQLKKSRQMKPLLIFGDCERDVDKLWKLLKCCQKIVNITFASNFKAIIY